MDIVERLLDYDKRADWSHVKTPDVCIEAADEIERLRKALQKIADWPDYRLPSHQEIARAALKETE